MKKSVLLWGAVAAAAVIAFLLVMSAGIQAAKETVPPPYAGLKNPFPWNDPPAQQAGKRLYQQFCAGCHGDNGSAIPSANFAAAGFPSDLEQNPDYYFWMLSDGRLNKGMPPFKASFSEEQRWQLLTYLGAIGTPAPAPRAAPAPANNPPGSIGASGGGNILLLPSPIQARAGQQITLSAALRDSQDHPVAGALVQFYVKVDFFTSGLVQVGEATTDGQGVATVKFTPRENNDIQLVVKSQDAADATGTITLAPAQASLYSAQAGLKMPSPPIGRNIFVDGQPQPDFDGGAKAPTGSFRLPGGMFSWLLLVVVTVMMIWFSYFRVIYQVFRIPIVKEMGDTNTRLVPLVGLVFVAVVGAALAVVLLRGPYTHLNLRP